MTYGEARDKTLQLINQYSLGGQPIPSSYNDQQDYINRIPGLLNDAMVFVATGIRPVCEYEKLNFKYACRMGDWYRFELPSDFYEMDTSGLLVVDGDRAYYTTDYKLVSNAFMLVPFIRGEVTMVYHRMPTLLPAKPDEDMELSCEPVVQQALPYYAASQLVMQDDAYAQSSLYSEWQNRISLLKPKLHPERGIVEDAYGMDGWGDF